MNSNNFQQRCPQRHIFRVPKISVVFVFNEMHYLYLFQSSANQYSHHRYVLFLFTQLISLIPTCKQFEKNI